MNLRGLAPGLLVMFVLGGCPVAKSARAAEQLFGAPEQQGLLVLDVPAKWSVSTRERKRMPPSTTIGTGDGEVTFSILWNAHDDSNFNSPGQLRASLEGAAEEFLVWAIESSPKLEELSGPEVSGFYFSMTRWEFAESPEPPPGQHRDYTPGIFAVGDYQVFFTMTSREKDSPGRLRILEMFRQARFRSASALEEGSFQERPK